MNENNLPMPQAIMAFGLTNIGCNQSDSTFIIHTASATQSQEDTPAAPIKFRYIISDNPAEIKEIEDTMSIYICSNNPSELCTYLFENEGTIFHKMPIHADTIFSHITDRWGDQNRILKTGLRTAWKRHRPA